MKLIDGRTGLQIEINRPVFGIKGDSYTVLRVVDEGWLSAKAFGVWQGRTGWIKLKVSYLVPGARLQRCLVVP